MRGIRYEKWNHESPITTDEVLSDARFEVVSFPHINDVTTVIFKEINSGLLRERLGLLLQVRIHGSLIIQLIVERWP